METQAQVHPESAVYLHSTGGAFLKHLNRHNPKSAEFSPWTFLYSFSLQPFIRIHHGLDLTWPFNLNLYLLVKNGLIGNCRRGSRGSSDPSSWKFKLSNRHHQHPLEFFFRSAQKLYTNMYMWRRLTLQNLSHSKIIKFFGPKPSGLKLFESKFLKVLFKKMFCPRKTKH